MQPHSQEYTKQKSIKLYFLLHKHTKIDTICKKNANIYCKLFVITQQK